MTLKNPILSNPIAVDIPKLNEILDALSKANPTDVDGISTGAMRFYEVSSGKWQWQLYNGTSWAPVPFMQHNVDQLDDYHAAITPAANTVAVRNASGVLEDSITGNAATASSAATLSQTLPVNKGGTGATTSEAARSNLGVPPTSHASTATTYGVGNATQYGHLKLSDATDSASSTSGGAAATPAAVKAAKEAADVAQSAANNAQSSANAAMTKASTLATASAAGIVKPGKGMTVNAEGALNVSLNNTVTSTSTTQSATANAVKTAYDKAVEANDKAGIIRLFNSRLVITSSNAAWTPPVTGWARVTVIGGGGAGGDGGIGNGETTPRYGGGQGGASSFGGFAAFGGSGGGSGGMRAASGGCSGGGGGEAGHVVSGYVYLDVSSPVEIVIGAGGQPSKGRVPESDADYAGCAGVGPHAGRGGQIRSPGGGAAGAGNGSSGSIDNGSDGGNGGSGGSNGTGYGGGGGGGAGGCENIKTGRNGFGGRGADNGVDGKRGNRGYYGQGGAGGSGAVIIEYYDPAKEVA